MNIYFFKHSQSILYVAICFLLFITSNKAFANTDNANVTASVEIAIPTLHVNPYHKPYIAVWLETLDRQYVTTVKLFADDPEWYKDLRQWWRKVGRAQVNIDGVTAATKRPGKLLLQWDGTNEKKQKVPKGDYYLNVEFSREEGGRDFARQKITLGNEGVFSIAGKTEFGNITIHVFEQNDK